MRSKLYAQLRVLLPTLLKLYVPTFIMLFIVAFVSFQLHVPVSKSTRDPAAILNVNPFLGILSNIGILFWCACAAICFFSFAVLRNKAISGEFPAFFLLSGLITSALLLDDLFLFHEKIFPGYFHIHEKVVFLGYAIMILLYLMRFRISILETEFVLLLFAFGFFGLSIIVDTLPETLLTWHYLFEDGFKLFGVVTGVWNTSLCSLTI